MESKQKVGVIGIGLIGGSIALGLRESGWASEIIGIDTNPEHQSKALSLRLVDRVMTWENALHEVDIFVTSTPVDVLVSIIPKILDQLKPHQLIIEVGSTKSPVYEALKNHPKRAQFVSTHPMAGTEHEGYAASFPTLFEGSTWIL